MLHEAVEQVDRMYEVILHLSFVFWLGMCIFYISRPCASMFHPATYYLFFHGLVFAVRPLFQYWWEIETIYEIYLFYPTENVRILSILVANLGLVSFMAVILTIGNQPFRWLSKPALARQKRPFSLAIFPFIISLPLISYSLYYLLSRKFVDPSEMVNLYTDITRRYVQTEVAGYVVDANMMLGAFGCIFAWSARFRWWSLIPFLTFFALRVVNGTGRFAFIMVIASLLLFYLYDNHRRWLQLKFIFPALLVLFIFKQVGDNRRVFIEMIKPPEVLMSEEVPREDKGIMYSMDFANFEYLQYLIRVVPEMTGTYGYFLETLELFTAPIPRVIWTSKPNGQPIELYNLFDYGRPIGMSWSLPGAGWQGFGLIGVVLWCAMGGAIWGYLYRWYVTSEQNVFQTCYYFLLLPLSVQWFRDGSILTLVKFPLFFLLPVAMVQFCAVATKWGPYSDAHAARRRAMAAAASQEAPPPAPRSRMARRG